MKTFLKSCLLGAAFSASLVPALAAAQSPPSSRHQISMQQADIRAFIDDVSMVTRKTFIIDPRVQGKVTVSSEEELSAGEVFEVFKDVMRVHGYTTIRTATGEYRVTLLQGAAQDAPFTQGDGINGRMATTVLRLASGDAAAMAKLIKPVLHSQGIVTANAGGKVLVVTDFPENLRKARQIIAASDTNGAVMETVQLSNLTALDAEDALKSLGGPRADFKAVAMPGSNSLLLEGAPEKLAQLKGVLAQMDAGGAAPRGAVSVLPLRYANGGEIIEMLNTLLPAYSQEGLPDPTVAYEPGSNAIIISAAGETQRELEAIIRQIDVRRPQVLVEAMIVEISDDASKELGVQFALAGVNGSAVPFIGTNFSRSAPDILTLTGALAGDDLGLNNNGALETAAINSLIGLDGGIIGGSGRSGDTLFSAILTAVETDINSNVLSTPFVTTLDNVPATFLVGQEIPVATSSSVTGTAANPFTTFERIPVGIQLDVLPQISEGDVIRLEIKQEVSSIAGALSNLTSDFVTNTREISTTVLANDGEVIVLGGLIQDDEEVNITKVPLLGDAPLIGPLFRSKGKSGVRTNLMVFLRPTIIRNGQDAREATQKRLNQIRSADRIQSGRTVTKIDQAISGQNFGDALSAGTQGRLNPDRGR